MQGWVALSGLKYGADLVLYQVHPADCHADFCAIALPAEPRPSSCLAPDSTAVCGNSPEPGRAPRVDFEAAGGAFTEPSGSSPSAGCESDCGTGAAPDRSHSAERSGACKDSWRDSSACGAAAGSRALMEENGDSFAHLTVDDAAHRPHDEGLRLGSRRLAWNDLEAANRLCTQVRRTPYPILSGPPRLAWRRRS